MKSSDRELDNKFLTSGQERIRLEIALERFFVPGEEETELYDRYLEYLQRRFRPAMEQLIRSGRNPQAELLFSKVDVSRGQLEELLATAQENHNTECLLFLLERKKEQFGFGGKDMEL